MLLVARSEPAFPRGSGSAQPIGWPPRSGRMRLSGASAKKVTRLPSGVVTPSTSSWVVYACRSVTKIAGMSKVMPPRPVRSVAE